MKSSNNGGNFGDTSPNLDPERLKGLFELYFEQNADKSRQRKQKYEEYSLAFAMSQMFSPKQKELFKKMLEGLPLTKTEQENYSSSVKKRWLRWQTRNGMVLRGSCWRNKRCSLLVNMKGGQLAAF